MIVKCFQLKILYGFVQSKLLVNVFIFSNFKTTADTGDFATHFSLWSNKVQFDRANLFYVESLTICNFYFLTNG